MFSTGEEAKICPKCGGEATYIEEYKRFYCYSCDVYIEPVERVIEEKIDVEEKTDEVALEPVPTEDQDLDDYLSELYAASPIEKQEVEVAEKEVEPPPRKRKKIFKKYRYRTRLLKGSILPILYGIISIQMLNKYVYEFPGYFEYEMMIILTGFILGFGAISSITFSNLARAKKKGKKGCELNLKVGIIIFIPFIIILLILAFFFGISTAWQFSMGFFLAAIFPPLVVIIYEAGSKGKFFVRELKDDPSKGRKLIFIQ